MFSGAVGILTMPDVAFFGQGIDCNVCRRKRFASGKRPAPLRTGTANALENHPQFHLPMSKGPEYSSGTDEVIAVITPTLIRRAMAAMLFALLGVMLIWGALGGKAEGASWKALSVVTGSGALLLGQWLWRATSVSLEFTREGVRDSAGRLLCSMEKIASVDRGAFAFKPSNGLIVHLTEPASAAWVPGIWWRFRQRVGIGGVTSPAEARNMADAMSLLLEQRRQNP